MRRAMAEAEVGDDVYGEDPTVNRLEQRAAEILGKPAALFVPTGCMGNAIGIRLHTQHGDEVICDHRAHVLDWELATHASFSGCQLRPIPTADGILRWPEIERVIRPRDPTHNSATTAISLEHAHNMGGGTLYPLEEIDTICDRAHERGMKVHMDGARLFNAAAASGVPAERIASKLDTVMFCLSKGLGAPVVVDAGGNGGRHRAGQGIPQDLRRRHASSGGSGRSRPHRAGANAGATGGGSRQCKINRERIGRPRGRDHRSREDRHQYRDLRGSKTC